MKHTLKAKYAADGLSAHRQRIEATQPAVVARRREAARRQEIVDRVSARFAESSRPKHDNLTANSKAIRAAAQANMAKWIADSMSKSFFAALSGTKPRDHDDQVDAIKYAMTATRAGKSISPFDVVRPVKYTAVGAGNPFPIILMDDITC